MSTLFSPLSTRLVQPTSALSDGNGKITLTLGPAALGEVWEGTITVFGAPSGAQWTSLVGSQSWGTWVGSSNFGPIQLFSGESFQASGTGLQPNTQYTMQLNGRWLPDTADIVPKGPIAPTSVTAIETTTLLVNGETVGPLANRDFTPPVLTRRLTIITATPFSLQGFTTGVGVAGGLVYFSTTVNDNNIHKYEIDIEPAIDSKMRFTNSDTVNTRAVWILASFTNTLVKLNDTVTITPASGALFTVDTNFNPNVATARYSSGTQFSMLIAPPGGSLNIRLHQVALRMLITDTTARTFEIQGQTSPAAQPTAPGRLSIVNTAINSLTFDFQGASLGGSNIGLVAGFDGAVTNSVADVTVTYEVQ